MKNLIALIVASIAVFPCQAKKVDQPDKLCAPLRAFVASVKPDETKKLELDTSWGGAFKDEKKSDDLVLSSKRCNHYGYGPAKAVCEYLMENSAVEFAGNNAKRALACLSPGTKFGRGMDLNRADFSFRYGTGQRGSLVSVTFDEDSRIGGMALTITADGY